MHTDRDSYLRRLWSGDEMVGETIQVSYKKPPQQITRRGITTWQDSEDVTEEVNIRLGKGKVQRELTDYKDAREVYVTHPNFIFRTVAGYRIAILEPQLHKEQRLEEPRPVQAQFL